MTGRTGAVGQTPANPPAVETPASPSTYQRTKDGIGAGTSYIAKTVRNSTPWYYFSLPFSAVGSVLIGIWARISKAIWGSPTPVSKEVKDVKINVPGFFGGAGSVKKISPEIALRKEWLTLEEVIKQQDTGFTMDQAKIQGWVQVDIPGKLWGSNKMLLKDAIEGGYMTVKDAIKAGHITEELAAKAPWLKLVTPEKK